MENKPRYKVFRFENDAQWTTGRECTISGAGKPDLPISSPPEFKGRGDLWTPEDLLLASVNVCVLLGFANLAQSRSLDFAAYESSAEGVLEFRDGAYRFVDVTLYPHITLKSNEQIELARSTLDNAHKMCLISNSLLAEVKLFPDFHVAES